MRHRWVVIIPMEGIYGYNMAQFNWLLISALLLLVFACGHNRPDETLEPPINALVPTAEPRKLLVGAGIYDITGPASELGMMGYAQLSQKTAGILQRIYARAFVFVDPVYEKKRMVFVSADLGQLFQSVQQGVLKQLKPIFGDLYNEKNVMLSATHSHSGPGGYSHDLLYNLTTLGFSKQNYKAITQGIVQAIVRAHHNVQPANIKLNIGQVLDASFNRSPDAYNLNPLAEREKYGDNVDRSMLQLRMDNQNGPFAILNWFAVHGTSLNNANLLISGDNKGYASSQFERMLKSNYDDHAFVAAFAQEASGDITPNVLGTMGQDGLLGIEKLMHDGGQQLATAIALFHDENAVDIVGDLDYRQVYVDMSKVTIDAKYTAGDGEQRTCPSAIGISMLAGAEDGPGFGEQGINCDKLSGLFGPVFAAYLPFSCAAPPKDACQKEKPIVLTTGTTSPPMIPQILPFQIFTLGQLAIVALPFEITTMAGRRIKQLVKDELQALGVEHVVIAGLANAYAGYITTREEYRAQRYEGASNQFGPYALNAILQTLADLSEQLVARRTGQSGPTPLDLSKGQITIQTPVVLDAMPIMPMLKGKSFGAVKTDVMAEYRPFDTVVAQFWGAHPKNNLLINDSFLFVEKLNFGNWEIVFRDRDIETTMEWAREGLASSVITVVWRIPAGTEGKFRLRHKGYARSLLQNLEPYEGISSEFSVVP